LKESNPLSHLLKIEAQAMTESQKESKNPVCEIKFGKIDEFTLGQYFMTYQLIVGMLGRIHADQCFQSARRRTWKNNN
jgi:hypothetical protein